MIFDSLPMGNGTVEVCGSIHVACSDLVDVASDSIYLIEE
jgi:hypothetical protein